MAHEVGLRLCKTQSQDDPSLSPLVVSQSVAHVVKSDTSYVNGHHVDTQGVSAEMNPESLIALLKGNYTPEILLPAKIIQIVIMRNLC